MWNVEIALGAAVKVVESAQIRSKEISRYVPGRDEEVGGDEDARSADPNDALPIGIVDVPENASHQRLHSAQDHWKVCKHCLLGLTLGISRSGAHSDTRRCRLHAKLAGC
jgi:hypothetical protein